MANRKSENNYVVQVVNPPDKKHIEIKIKELSKLLSSEMSKIK